MDMGGENTMSGGSIPLDVVTNILCSLPAKSVLRFKAVSKAWCSLIDSSYFAHLQLSASIETNNDLMLVILSNQRTGDDGNPGLVLCADFYSLDDDIVEVNDGDGGASNRLFYVLLVNGALHWLAPASNYDGDRGQYEIVALHLGTLERYKLPLPLGVKYRRRATLRILEGSLCATFTDYGNQVMTYAIDVWVMIEYGGEWTKLLNFSTNISNHNWVYPIAYSKSRDKVLLHFRDPDDNLRWYHLKQEKLIPIVIPGAPKSFQPMLCLPTLVNYRS
ncbi:hypothetical protein Tsubulata_026660 [Turnera subulata]|uniref:F-box domain-containing protein n=1 Tax=Turnera subulata TaxID=218843 RepID=A0A9Q0FXI7_9ROSI|nr:hypothetical protein Tsubulata_026660 [Turnera subulata]